MLTLLTYMAHAGSGCRPKLVRAESCRSVPALMVTRSRLCCCGFLQSISRPFKEFCEQFLVACFHPRLQCTASLLAVIAELRRVLIVGCHMLDSESYTLRRAISCKELGLGGMVKAWIETICMFSKPFCWFVVWSQF